MSTRVFRRCGTGPTTLTIRCIEALQPLHFRSGEELEVTPQRYVRLYNQQLPQSALGSGVPMQAMQDWHTRKPDLFRKQPYHLTRCDSYIDGICHVGVIPDAAI